MKRLLKNALLMFFTLTLLCAMCPAAPSAASTRKCYTITSGNTPVYGNTGLTRKIGTIYGSDQITVNTVKSAYCYVTYPISGGRTKSGYIRTSAILLGTGGNSYKARAKMTTYKRPGGASYGYVSSGDTVTVLGASGSYTQVKYPVSGGYKYAFITTANANNYLYGSSSAVNYSNVANGTYVLYSAVGSNRVLDVSGGSSAEGTNIQIWESNGTDAQKYNISKQSNGWYRIANVNGRALDVDKAERRNGANVIQWGWSGAENQQWKFVYAGGGYYYIQSRLGYYLDVSGAGTANGTNVQIWEKNNTNAQKWKLVSAGNSSGEAQTPATAGVSYAPYRGVSYTDKGLSAARVQALNKAKQMVTIQWKAPCDFPTWASKGGVFNRATATDGSSAAKFVKGKTYTGVPYSMTNHSYDDVAWANLLRRGITQSSMTARFSNYPVKGTAKGMDCSYFVYEAIKSAVGSGRISYQVTGTMMKSSYYKKIARSRMKPGDIFLSTGHVMMYVGKVGNQYAVFEADAEDSKCSYNVYSENYIKRYGCYKYTGFSD